eukprot:scaffold256394_cov36-Tisochrysis_lutea.AAC.1
MPSPPSVAFPAASFVELQRVKNGMEARPPPVTKLSRGSSFMKKRSCGPSSRVVPRMMTMRSCGPSQSS